MEGNIVKEYAAKVQHLNTAFKNLISNKFIPVIHGEKSYTIDNIKEAQDNLEKKEFTISVCGQINAGKSSFLNYLLFNDKEVLPADDTPWTAKLTTVRYGEENSATATYYNIEEWELLKNQKVANEEGNATTYYNEFLKEEVNNAAFNGLHAESFITSNNKKVTGIALNDLRDYVSKSGRMTPFVKIVDIKVNNPLTKGVIFVDTPGINDRNELRSKVTEDWIKKSSAVIYLFYAGQALSSADYVFIDQHLSSVPTDKILFALIKADISEDYEGARAFVEKTLLEDEELKKRKFITDKKSVYPISTLAALINYKQLNEIGLNEDEEFHLDRIMNQSPSFIKNNGFIEEFVKALQSHLMTQTGNAIIDKTKEFLNDIFKTNEVSLLSDLNTTKDKLKSLNLSDTELNKKISDLNELIDEIEKFKVKFKRNTLDKQVEGIKTNLKIELTKLRVSGFDSLKNTIDDVASESIESLRDLATHLTRQSLVDASNKLHYLILFDLSIEKELNSILETFSNKFEEILSDIPLYDGSLFCVIQNPSSLVDNISYNELAVKKLKKTCGLYYFGFINVKKVKTKISAQIQKIYEVHLDYIISNVVINIDNVIKENMDEVYNNVNNEVRKIKSNSISLSESRKDIDEQKNNFQSEIVILQDRLDFLKSHYKSFQSCI
jgi:hypothetical protein